MKIRSGYRSALPLAGLACVLAVGVVSCGGSTSPPPSSGARPASSSASSTPSTATATPSPTTSASASPTPAVSVHAAAKGEPALIRVLGYDYADTNENTNLAKALAQGINRSAPGMVTGSSTHWVVKDGKDVVLLLELKVAKRYASRSSVLFTGVKVGVEQLTLGLKAVKTTTIATEKVAYASAVDDGSLVTAYGWYHDGVMTYVLGIVDEGANSDAAEGASFVRSYLTTAHA